MKPEFPELLQILYDELCIRYGEPTLTKNTYFTIGSFEWKIGKQSHSLIVNWYGIWYMIFPRLELEKQRYSENSKEVWVLPTNSNIEKLLFFLKVLEI